MNKSIVVLFILFSNIAKSQDDCVFNNDYQGLTKDWIEETGTNYKFVWVEELNSFVARLSNVEIISLSAGGCYSSGRTIKYQNTEIDSFDNIDFWMTMALKLAKEFQMDLFIKPLEEKSWNLKYENERNLIYGIPIDSDEYRIVEGIILERDEKSHALVLSYYIN